MKILPIIGILTCVSLGVTGQLLIKYGINLIPKTPGLLQYYFHVLSCPYVLFGMSLYVVAALIWFKVLKLVDISYAYPMVSIGYVLILIFSRIFLGENVSWLRWCGVFLICTGVYIISLTR